VLDEGERSGAAAEVSFRTALDVAHNQLGRLLLARGAVAAVHDLVAPLYARFTEGHDTLGLREARVLLNQLTAVR
jgi:hypothetical protein